MPDLAARVGTWIVRAGVALAAAAAVSLPGALPAAAAETRVAVAANFIAAAQAVAAAFSAETGHRAKLSFGSTGQLYGQIVQGAPFELFLAADDLHPAGTIAEGLGVPDSAFTYAVGRIALWSRDPDLIAGPAVLETGRFDRLAIANPATAPYGAAAVAVLRALGRYAALRPRLVQGNSIAQTYQFVETGNAELGFVALSQLAGREAGSRWVVPQDLYPPIRQDAVLLQAGRDNPAAQAFLAFLKSPKAAAIIGRLGYATASPG